MRNFFVGLLVLCGAISSCQVYNFEPVVPIVFKQYDQREKGFRLVLKPNIMVVFDKSGSMREKIDPNCTDTPAKPCPTRISEARSAMTAFLATDGGSGTLARFGLTFFPGSVAQSGSGVDNQCGMPSSILVPFPPNKESDAGVVTDTGADAELQANADLISMNISSVTPSGGTPTRSVLDFVRVTDGGFSANDPRGKYVLLVTDGLPNCNSDNPNGVCAYTRYAGTVADGGVVPAEVAAAIATCACQSAIPNVPSGTFCLFDDSCRIGCLDNDATVSAARRLLASGTRTIVVGFGAETTGGAANSVLSAIARVGGYPRACPSGLDSECGANDTCDVANNVCNRPYYQVANGTELSTALKQIIQDLPKPCQFQLTAQPTDPRYVSVFADGVEIAPDPANTPLENATTWSYNAGVVTFAPNGDICKKINAADNQTAVDLEFRIVRSL